MGNTIDRGNNTANGIKKEIDSSPIEFDYDIAFITALAEPELSQVKALCTKWDKVDLPRDSTIYYTSK